MTDTYLVTGATGFLGTAITKSLLATGYKVRAYARNEHSHEALAKSIPDEQKGNLSNLLGSVEDSKRLAKALRGVDYCIHAAAQKAIPLAEYDPGSCLSTNVEGTRHVADACLEAGVSKAVFVSTDKAAAPSTLYGASKLCAERLWLASNRYSAGKGTEYVACRYGNVFGSRGSVLEKWGSGPILITSPHCSRFHITRKQAVDFVLHVLTSGSGGELWIPRLPSYTVKDLAEAYMFLHGINAKPQYIGMRPGEKMHEQLIGSNESPSCKYEGESHYILEPGRVHGNGGWKIQSGVDPAGHRTYLGQRQLREAIVEWEAERGVANA